MRSQKNRNLFRRLINHTPHTANRIPLLRLPFKNKYLTYIFCFLLSTFCFLLISCDKQDMIMNRWTLQSVNINGQPIDSLQMKYHLLPKYTDYVFFMESSLVVYTRINGQATASADGFYKFIDKSNIEMNFTLLNRKSIIKAKIQKLTKREMNLEYKDNGDTYFLKLYGN